MQARRDPARMDARRAGAEQVEERVAPAPVALAHPADVAVHRAGADELGQRDLLEHLRVAEHALGLDDGVDEARREHQPSEPQAGRESLARGAGVDDVLRPEALQRAGRLPVVAELAVVVVLDDDGRRGRAPTRRTPPAAAARASPPSGNWWAGVRSTAPARRPDGSGRAPSSSTASRVTRRPVLATTARCWCRHGSSMASVRTPAVSRSAWHSTPSACVKPAQTTMSAGSAMTPRVRPRYAASAARSSGRPRGSPPPSAWSGAAASARRSARSHPARGNEPTSGRPTRRSKRGGPSRPRSCPCPRRARRRRPAPPAAPARSRPASARRGSSAGSPPPRAGRRPRRRCRARGRGRGRGRGSTARALRVAGARRGSPSAALARAPRAGRRPPRGPRGGQGKLAQSYRPELALSIGSVGHERGAHDHAAAEHFSSEELAALLYAIATIGTWNRLAVATHAVFEP